tara:strand:+ start:93805 stop:94944 length:1140 start_codon:yes stop_codon:yes gene_type:complete
MPLPPLALYIHLPWCERKCPYCDFNSHAAPHIPEQRYIDALISDLRSDLHLVGQREVQSLFIGGGTPSLFSGAAIARLMEAVAFHLTLSADLEATMEANPGSAEARKFAEFHAAGINRLSLGIQSFSDDQLQRLGRVHDSDQAIAAVNFAREAGFGNINIDLMHGLPGQTPALAMADLQQAISLTPNHVSWYQLTIEPNTVFHSHPPRLPVEDALADIQAAGETLLADAGYRQYEVSAYSQPGRQCHHNLNYWGFGDYLGIGAGAHGKISQTDGSITRYAKRRQPDAYMDSLPNGFISSKRILQAEEIAGEFMLNALRLNNGFDLTIFEERTGLGAATIQDDLLQLSDQGLLDIGAGRVKTTELGRRFLDDVVGRFFPT